MNSSKQWITTTNMSVTYEPIAKLNQCTTGSTVSRREIKRVAFELPVLVQPRTEKENLPRYESETTKAILRGAGREMKVTGRNLYGMSTTRRQFRWDTGLPTTR